MNGGGQHMTEPVYLSDEVPFSLSCYDCDCDSPHCYDEAVHAGWTQIQYTPDGLGENYLGLCPECSEKWDDPGCSGVAEVP
jgi:hypothetical protein